MFNRNNMNLSIMNEEQTIHSSRAPHKKTIHRWATREATRIYHVYY